MTDSRTAAVELARRGFRVFRLNHQSLQPLKAGWPETASSDPEVVYRDFTDAVGESVIDAPAIATGKDLVVWDFDCKKGRAGLLSLAELLAEGLPDDTFTVRTASGGLHKYYDHHKSVEIRNRTGLMEGVDIRGYHGFVVAPGASREGVGDYTIVNDVAPLLLPTKFIDALGRRHKERQPTEVTDKFEDDWSISESIKLLENLEAIDGQKHNDLVATWQKCFDLGVTPDTLAGLTEQHVDWFAAAYTQDLERDLGSIVAGRMRDGKAWGVDHPRARPSVYATFERVALLDVAHERPRGAGPGSISGSIFALDCYAAEGTDADNPLVPDLLDLNSVVAFYGPSNVGKSFAGASLAYAVATGGQWAGRAAVRGLAVYIAYEGARRFRRRLAALVEHHKPDGAVPLALVPPPKGSIHSPGWHTAVLAEIRRLETVSGEPARLVIVDTLAAARVGAGKEENDNDAMNEVASVLRRLADATGACIMVIHHTGKDKEKGMRGASALEGAVDTALMLDEGVLRVTKQREYDRGPDLPVSTTQVTMSMEKGGAKSLVTTVGGARITVEADAEGPILDAIDKGAVLSASKFSPSYAPRILAALPDMPTEKEIEFSMGKLIAWGFIEMASTKDKAGRRTTRLVRVKV